MIGISTALQVHASGAGKLQLQPQIANCLLYGDLACMCHSYCGGLVNIPVKRAKALILAQAQNQWQNMHIV